MLSFRRCGSRFPQGGNSSIESLPEGNTRMSITRRDFARASAVTALSYSRILGANDRIVMGLVGAGERGSYVMSLFQKEPGIEVHAICDVYLSRV